MTGAVFRGFGKLKNAGPCRAICGKVKTSKQKTKNDNGQTHSNKIISGGVLEDMSLASRTISIVLGLGLVGYVLGLGLVDKVVRMSDLVNRDA